MVGRPSSSGGMGMDASMSQPDFDMEQARPHTALGLSQVSFDGSGASALESASAYDLEYKKRFGDYRALSAPDGGGGGLNASAGSLGQSGRLRTEDFLRFSRPARVTGMRDKLKLETMSRAYGIPGKKKHRQLSPVKQRVSHVTGTTPGQPFIEDPIEVANCDEVIISWKPPMNAGGAPLEAYRIKYSAAHIKGVNRTTPPADDMVIVQTIPDPTARRASIRGLLPGTVYSFRMVASNALGWGKPGRAYYATTLSHPVPRFVVGNRQKDSLELSWSVPGGFIDVTEVQIEYWQYSKSNIPEEENALESGDTLDASVMSQRPSTSPSKSRQSLGGGGRPSTVDGSMRGPNADMSALAQRGTSSRCITIDAQRHDHCTLKDLMPGTVYAIRGRAIRRAPSHYDERDPRYAALLEAGLVDLGRASHTCPWSRAIKARSIADVPFIPKVKVVRPGSVSVTLEWREPRDNGEQITSYDVQICDAVQELEDMWVSKAVPGTRLYTSFSELPSFTAHRVRVRAINDIGTSEYSASFAFQTLPSESVPDLVRMRGDEDGRTENSVVVNWDRPLEVPGCPLDGFDMEYQVSRLQAGAMIDTQEWVHLTHPPRATSFTLEDLNPGNIVQFRMRALNVNGTGPWSDVVECRTEADVPAAPHIAASKVGATEVTVYWKTPLENGSDIANYQVEYALASDPTQWTRLEEAQPGVRKDNTAAPKKQSALSKLRSTAKDIGAASDAGAALEAENMHAMEGLFSFETHTVRVRAKNERGFSEWSAVHTFTTDPSENIPGTMFLDGGDLCADGISHATTDSLTFIWTPPAEVAGVILQRFQLEYRLKPRIRNEDPGKWSLKVLKYSDTEWCLTPLEPGQWTEARVRAKNANGFGHWSASALVQATPVPPDPLAIEEIETTANKTSQSALPSEPREPTHHCDLAWMPSWNNGAEVQEYEVHVALASGEEYALGPYTPYKVQGELGDYGLEKARLQVEQLLPFEVHDIRIRAKNRKGWSDWSVVSQFKTKPSMASPPQVTMTVAKARGPAEGDVAGDITSTGVTVRWNRPPEVPGVELLGYNVEYKETGGDPGVELEAGFSGEWQLIEVGPNELSVKIPLLPGMRFESRVAGKNINGVGKMSGEVDSKALPIPPEPPVDANHSEVVDISTLVKWTRPHRNGAIILEYEVEPMPLADATTAKAVPPAKLIHPLYTHARMGTLEPYSEYVISIRARNIAGWSQAAVINMRTGSSSKKPGYCAMVKNADEEPYSCAVQWEVPASLPGTTVDQFTIRTRLHDAVGSDEHRKTLNELMSSANELSELLYTVLEEGNTLKALKMISETSNEMVMEAEKKFGREHREGVMGVVAKFADAGFCTLFKQRLLAARDDGSAPIDSVIEKQMAQYRAALTVKPGATIQNVENVCKIICNNNPGQVLRFCTSYVNEFGFTPHEMLRSAAETSGTPDDEQFVEAALALLPPETDFKFRHVSLAAEIERIIMGGSAYELGVIGTRTTSEIRDMVDLYRRRFGAPVLERIKGKSNGVAELQSMLLMLLDCMRLEDCPVVDAAVQDDVEFLKGLSNTGGEAKENNRLIEIAAVRSHAHLIALNKCFKAKTGKLLDGYFAGSEFMKAVNICLTGTPEPVAEPAEPDDAVEEGWKEETLTKTSWELAKLKPGTPVEVMFRAHNPNGFGPWTGAVKFSTKPIAPDEPLVLTVEPEHETMKVTFEQPQCNGDLVSHYDIDINGVLTEQVEVEISEFETVSPEPFSAVISGLVPFTDYSVRVRAHNKAGTSPWGAAKQFQTKLSPAVLAIQDSCFPEKGGKKDPFLVFQTLWALTNDEIMVTRDIYRRKFGQDLKDVLQKMTSGPFQLITLMLLDKLRVEFGMLSVRVDDGRKLFNISSTRTMNPYCVAKLGGAEEKEGVAAEAKVQKKTRVVYGGTTPKWNQELSFSITPYEKTLVLTVMDEDLRDDHNEIGAVEIDLKDVLDKQGETVEQTVTIVDSTGDRGEIRLGLRFEGVRETEAHADTEAEEWRKATKVKLGTDFEAGTKVMLGNNRAQLQLMCERYVKAYNVTPHDDLRGELFLKSSTKLWSEAIIDVILPSEEEGGGMNHRWGAGPPKK